jgi:hypothetical protein
VTALSGRGRGRGRGRIKVAGREAVLLRSVDLAAVVETTRAKLCAAYILWRAKPLFVAGGSEVTPTFPGCLHRDIVVGNLW